MANKIITSYDNDTGVTVVVHDEGKRSIIKIDTGWHFYIKGSDYEKARLILQDFRAIISGMEQAGEYVKINCQMRYQYDDNIKNLRKYLEDVGVEVFEYDLNKTKRYMVDSLSEIETDLKILYFDIETDDRKGGIKIGRDRIVSWAACDDKDKIYFETGDERDILKKFISTIKKYDIITGWNSGGFDLPYIQERCELYGIKYDWRQTVHIDMMERCFKVYGYEANIIGLKNFSLNEIARCMLGKEKVDTQGEKIWDLFLNNPGKLKEYNIQDTLLLKELNNKLGIIKVMIMECAWTGSFMFKFYIGELLDNYILREAKKRGIVLKSKPSNICKTCKSKHIYLDEDDPEYIAYDHEDSSQRALLDKIKIVGGYVATPVSGLYEHVNICDFKSLYPSIIVGWNIGSDSLNEELSIEGKFKMDNWLHGEKIETVPFKAWNEFLISEKKRLDPEDKHIQTANNAFFKRDVPSFIGDLVQNLLNQRAEYKKKLKALDFDTPEYNNAYSIERVVKEMANSMFGITCDKNSRYFNRYVSEGITYTGQWLNKLSSGIVEDIGLKSIYGDTDSIFVTGIDDLEPRIKEINKMLGSFLDKNIKLRKNIVYLEYEKHFSKLLLMEKKRYTGLLNMKDGKTIDKLFSRGTEDVKKSNTQLGKRTFQELVRLVFDDNTTLRDIMNYIEEQRFKLKKHQILPEDLLITTRVSKSMDNYKVKGVHTRLAQRLIDSGEILPIIEGEKRIGTRLEYIMVGKEGVRLDKYLGNFNRDYYWEIQIYAPLRRVLECAYPQEDWHQYDTLAEQYNLFS